MAHSKKARPGNTKKSRRPLIIGLSLVVMLGIVVVGLAAVAYTQLSGARDDLNRASTNASQLRNALTAGNQSKAASALQQMQSNVTSAQDSLGNPVLSAAAKTPFIGKNIKAVRTIADAVDSVAQDGLPPLVSVADKFNGKTFNPRDGKINVAAIAELSTSLAESSKAIAAANTRIQSVDSASLLGQLQKPVTDAQKQIGSASSIAERATVASRVLPKMLSGDKTYLLIFQNNAEIRATGGLPGSYAGLRVKDGAISLTSQGAGGDLGNLPEDTTSLTDEEKDLFTNKLVRDFRDVNFTPDFPRAAAIATAIIQKERGVSVDGVISLDPVTLSYLLRGLGPVELSDGTRLTSENAVEELLNNVYVKFPDNKDQDAFFESATQQIFDKVVAGAGDPTTVLKALTRATNERRVSVWSTDQSINDEIARTPLAHALPTGKDASPAIGYYLNDATGAKMQYYLKSDITGKSTQCTEDGVQSYTTEMSLASSAPADASTLPESIRGPGFGAVPGSMLMNLYVYAPTGGKITAVSFDGKETRFFQQLSQDGRPVAQITVQVNPGQTVKVGVNVDSGKGQTGATNVESTPSIKPRGSVTTWKSSC